MVRHCGNIVGVNGSSISGMVGVVVAMYVESSGDVDA